jgi:uncharacterized protein with GYD domain
MAAPAHHPPRDIYFSLWTITAEGLRNPRRLQETIEAASAMIRESKGECHLHVAIGGAYDMIGVAQNVSDERIIEIQHAIQAFGTVTTIFIKTKEFSLQRYGEHIQEVIKLHSIKP